MCVRTCSLGKCWLVRRYVGLPFHVATCPLPLAPSPLPVKLHGPLHHHSKSICTAYFAGLA